MERVAAEPDGWSALTDGQEGAGLPGRLFTDSHFTDGGIFDMMIEKGRSLSAGPERKPLDIFGFYKKEREFYARR